MDPSHAAESLRCGVVPLVRLITSKRTVLGSPFTSESVVPPIPLSRQIPFRRYRRAERIDTPCNPLTLHSPPSGTGQTNTRTCPLGPQTASPPDAGDQSHFLDGRHTDSTGSLARRRVRETVPKSALCPWTAAV